jgi:hypothetical protein
VNVPRKPVCTLSLLLSSLSRSREDGTALLNMLLSEAPDLAPGVYNNFEPINIPFTTVEKALPIWQDDPFLWKHRKGIRAEGSVWFANPNCFTNVEISTRSPVFSPQSFLRILKFCAERFNAALGYVHLMTQSEYDDCGYEPCYSTELGIIEHALKQGIPNACWAMIWGQTFIEMIGAEVLLTAPTHVTTELPGGRIYTQLTRDLFSVRDDYEDYRMRRESFKDHVGRQYFWGAQQVVRPNIKWAY